MWNQKKPETNKPKKKTGLWLGDRGQTKGYQIGRHRVKAGI